MSWTTIPSRYRVAAPIWTPKRPGTLSRQWRRKAAENPRLLIIVLRFALRFITGALLITGLLIITGLRIGFIARIVALLIGHRLHAVLIQLAAPLDGRMLGASVRIVFIARLVALFIGHRLHDVLIHLGALLARRIKRDIGRVAEAQRNLYRIAGSELGIDQRDRRVLHAQML